jgi:MoaA/NifB/PqqE/SkfB family radical SAM enzyme
VAKLVIELTNRCNLYCQHCFTGRHGGRDDLPLNLLAKILAEAKAYGFVLRVAIPLSIVTLLKCLGKHAPLAIVSV